jgi:hypothetical protein
MLGVNTLFSALSTDVQYTKKMKATMKFFIPFLPPNERLRTAELRFLRQKTRSGNKKSRKRKSKRYKLRVDVLRADRRVERFMLREK